MGTAIQAGRGRQCSRGGRDRRLSQSGLGLPPWCSSHSLSACLSALLPACSFCVNIPVLRPAAPHAHSPLPGHVPGVVLSFPSSCILKVSSNGFQFKIFYENNSLLPQSNQFFQLLLNLILFKTPEIGGLKKKLKLCISSQVA